MIKVVSVQEKDGKEVKTPSQLNLTTGELVSESEIKGNCKVEVKGGARYEATAKDGSHFVSMDDLKEIIFDIQ